jgi:hypothetical protein
MRNASREASSLASLTRSASLRDTPTAPRQRNITFYTALMYFIYFIVQHHHLHRHSSIYWLTADPWRVYDELGGVWPLEKRDCTMVPDGA